MTHQGAAMQNYNNELVKCERPRGGACRAGGEGVGRAGLRAQTTHSRVWGTVGAGVARRGRRGGRWNPPSARPRCGTHPVLAVSGASDRASGLGTHCLRSPRPLVSCGVSLTLGPLAPRPLALPHLSVLRSREIQRGGRVLSFLCVSTALPRSPTLGIEELCQKREELCRQIQQEEDEKQRLQNEVRQLTEKLARVNENLARKIASRNEFDQTIAETEAAYLKVRLGAVWGPACQASPTRVSGL